MKKSAVIAVVSAAVVLAAFLVYDGVFAHESEIGFFAMDTYTSVKVWGKNSEAVCENIKNAVSVLDTEVLSRTAEGSLIYEINRNGHGELNEKTEKYFSAVLDVCRKSGGAFDITLGAVSDLWGFGNDPKVPSGEELKQTLSNSGYEKIGLTSGQISLNASGAVIDMGAVGKGIALDEAKIYLENSKAKKAVVSVGGSVLLFGGGEFTVGIRNPNGDSASCVANLHVGEGCVSTSGVYERNFEENGKIYHHILDPETGYPVDNGLVGVTIVSESGLLSDALSTACFVLGKEKGALLASEYSAVAIFIYENKTVCVASEYADMLELTDEGYTVEEF